MKQREMDKPEIFEMIRLDNNDYLRFAVKIVAIISYNQFCRPIESLTLDYPIICCELTKVGLALLKFIETFVSPNTHVIMG